MEQAVSTAMAPVMAMISQVVRDIHDLKRDISCLRTVPGNVAVLNRKVDRIQQTLGMRPIQNEKITSVEDSSTSSSTISTGE